jgi:hypothetical protein
MVLLGIAFLKANEIDKKPASSESNDEMNVYDRMAYLTRVVSPILLPMIAGLGELREDEIIAAYEDE